MADRKFPYIHRIISIVKDYIYRFEFKGMHLPRIGNVI